MGERKTALVTGASRGIGRAIAVRLAKDGCDVAVIYAGNKEAAEETCRMIEENGVKSLAVCCDVSDPQQCKDAVKQVMDTFGSIDILVNNAGITRDALVLSMKEEDFQKVIDTNLNGAFYMIKNTYHAEAQKRTYYQHQFYFGRDGKCWSGKLCRCKSRIDWHDQVGCQGACRQRNYLQRNCSGIYPDRHDRSFVR